jgi:hypothetical protein
MAVFDEYSDYDSSRPRPGAMPSTHRAEPWTWGSSLTAAAVMAATTVTAVEFFRTKVRCIFRTKIRHLFCTTVLQFYSVLFLALRFIFVFIACVFSVCHCVCVVSLLSRCCTL